MIPRIRVIASAIQEEFAVDAPEQEELCAVSEDSGLDYLVRHAIQQELSSHDGEHVWHRLSRRVRGPFGSMAIEEPAMRGRTMPIPGESAQQTESRPDSMRHSLFRTAEATFSMR
jgi:hypothetical protein